LARVGGWPEQLQGRRLERVGMDGEKHGAGILDTHPARPERILRRHDPPCQFLDSARQGSTFQRVIAFILRHQLPGP
jgi:hypothetical protein